MLYYERDTPFDTLFNNIWCNVMKYKIEKNVYLAQPEIKTKQDEKQLLNKYQSLKDNDIGCFNVKRKELPIK